MPKYRMKPIIFDAFQVTYDLLREKHGRVEDGLRYYTSYIVVPAKDNKATNVADVGDWVVKISNNGKHYETYTVYTDLEFKKCFEEVEEKVDNG